MSAKKRFSILFYGDSIMDVDKNREDIKDLGSGFPKILSHKIQETYDECDFVFYNTSVGGQEVKDLNERIVNDCLKLMPDLVILLIGINDVWDNQHNDSFGTTEEQRRFEEEYEKLLKTFSENKINVLVLDPYVLSFPKKRLLWRKDLDPKLMIIKKLADKYNFSHIALDKILNETVRYEEIVDYTGTDGVHPTHKGHMLISEIVFERLEKILSISI